MSDWRETTIGEVIKLQRGMDITRAEQRVGTVPVVSSGGVASYHDTAISDGPGVVMGRKGSLGKVFYFDGPYWPHDTTLWVRDFMGNEARFVYYFLTQLDTTFLDVGTANPTLNRNHVHPLQTRWPSVDLQRGIAEVLGALDDKIGTNTNITKTALELADLIFERTAHRMAFVSSTFEDVASIQGGGTPSTKMDEFWGGEVSWATPTDVTNLGAPYLERTARQITEAGLQACSSVLHPTGSIFMTSRATIGAFAIAQRPTAVNQGFIVVNAKDPSMQWWLFHEMRNRVPEFLSHANGATFLELSRGRFKKLPVRLPSDPSAFVNQVEPLHARARAASVESAKLAATRNLLLPQLMSGKIRVKDAERVIEGVV